MVQIERFLLDDSYDLWISIKKRFDRRSAAQAESLFLDALIKIKYK